MATAYVIRLWRQLDDEMHKRHVMNARLSLDVLLREMLEPGPGRLSDSARRQRGICAVLWHCESILDARQKRLAFFAYNKETRKFRVLENIGLTEESRSRVQRELTGDKGLAGEAIRRPCEVVYVPDCSAPEARNRGYVHLRPDSRHGSMACVGIEVNGSVVGVLCADSWKKDAFSPRDLDALKSLASHIPAFYHRFPKP